MENEIKEKSRLINLIFIAMKTSNKYISGDLFFSLAFCSVNELKKIAKECHINVT